MIKVIENCTGKKRGGRVAKDRVAWSLGVENLLIAKRNPQHLCCGLVTAYFFLGIQKPTNKPHTKVCGTRKVFLF